MSTDEVLLEILATSPRMIIRFWAKVDRRGLSECWEWTAALANKGYGAFGIAGGGARARPVRSHRISWRLANGPITPGMEICHRCDNPPCVNPAHLFEGTQADNLLDAQRKGRLPVGGRHYSFKSRAVPIVQPGVRKLHAPRKVKLTPEAVMRIRELYGTTELTQEQLGAMFGVVRTQIGNVVRGVQW